jgi:hypothetical protein
MVRIIDHGGAVTLRKIRILRAQPTLIIIQFLGRDKHSIPMLILALKQSFKMIAKSLKR